MLSIQMTQGLAVGVLIAAAIALVVSGVVIYRRTNYTVGQIPLYTLNWVLTRVLWRVHVEGEVPMRGNEGAVIVCNHIGPLDPAFLALACDRPVHWMVAREYVVAGLFGMALRTLQVIPVNRGGIDTASTKIAVRYAARGDLVGIFPEGRINESGNFMLPGRPGAALIALRAQVPVVPCYLEGSPYDGTTSGFLFLPARTRLIVGKPIDLSAYYNRDDQDREMLKQLTLRFMREIAALAGRHDHEPTLAGRRWKPEPLAID